MIVNRLGTDNMIGQAQTYLEQLITEELERVLWFHNCHADSLPQHNVHLCGNGDAKMCLRSCACSNMYQLVWTDMHIYLTFDYIISLKIFTTKTISWNEFISKMTIKAIQQLRSACGGRKWLGLITTAVIKHVSYTPHYSSTLVWL